MGCAVSRETEPLDNKQLASLRKTLERLEEEERLAKVGEEASAAAAAEREAQCRLAEQEIWFRKNIPNYGAASYGAISQPTLEKAHNDALYVAINMGDEQVSTTEHTGGV
ncbi:hypothetical protein CYMTET_53529 [Cymbomonas tetramitiformis]|uniref:Uncharacterized protein n=1 Tax=Cymbomonas tetramitiformis TaxID=36881 RepID=A0AAE0ERM6_9CHLO|nr:hypothetical protein CYMTET_53529 [Cymbomonas tetramitiformis]